MDHKPWYKLNLFSCFAVLFYVGWFLYCHSRYGGYYQGAGYVALGWPLTSQYIDLYGKGMVEIDVENLFINIGAFLTATFGTVMFCQVWFKRISINTLLFLTAMVALSLMVWNQYFELSIRQYVRRNAFFGFLSLLMPVVAALLTGVWIVIKRMRAPRHKVEGWTDGPT